MYLEENDLFYRLQGPSGPTCYWFDPRHTSNRGNTLFADWHVEGLTYPDFISGSYLYLQ